MDIAAEFRRCLETLDVEGIKRLHAHTAPHLPPPADDAAALASLHIARTSTGSLDFKLRAYSHAWLCERGLPSQLPDRLKPRADRLYPRVVPGVGISVNFSSRLLKPAEALVQGAMETAVADAFANGDTDSAIVRPLMQAARETEMQALFGRIALPQELKAS